MRKWWVPGVLALFLGVAGCAIDPVSEPEPVADHRALCAEVLGGSAVEWLERQAAPVELDYATSADIAEARDRIHRNLRSWEPGQGHSAITLSNIDVCLAAGPGIGNYLLDYDTWHNGIDTVRAPVGGTRTRLNADVLLTAERSSGSRATGRYSLYVACQLPGAAPQQGRNVLVRGRLTDTLTSDKSPRTPLTHLLHSAHVMAKALGCTNKPVIPAEPPAFVK
ncbi:hypothetical protein ACFPM3_21575 [Streptomyces coeruleoprunus]|uniref:Lipoprotein n=1 Tax=Streptomyces coeruleoprunus TaxID=285563 RepID=A0ABV9XJV0_9ACTN